MASAVAEGPAGSLQIEAGILTVVFGGMVSALLPQPKADDLVEDG